MLTEEQRRFVTRRQVGYLGTVDALPAPHVMPACFAVGGDVIYVAIDEKPKSAAPRAMKRLQNIDGNPRVSILFSHYEDDWDRLGWVMVRGHAEIHDRGADRQVGINLLRARYPRYEGMDLEQRPLIAVTISIVSSWGDLSQ